MLLAFHKPYGVLSQFTPDGSPNRTLAEFNFPPGLYAIGRLDADSEGLLLFTDEPGLNTRLLHPRNAHEREYWAQVENIPSPESLARLGNGILIQGHRTLPCRARLLDPQPVVATENNATELQQPGNIREKTIPTIPPRIPPIRVRKNIPDAWITLELIEGKNRQVRRMTAAVGHPTLRLIRVRIGQFALGNLPSGQWRELDSDQRQLVLS